MHLVEHNELITDLDQLTDTSLARTIDAADVSGPWLPNGLPNGSSELVPTNPSLGTARSGGSWTEQGARLVPWLGLSVPLVLLSTSPIEGYILEASNSSPESIGALATRDARSYSSSTSPEAIGVPRLHSSLPVLEPELQLDAGNQEVHRTAMPPIPRLDLVAQDRDLFRSLLPESGLVPDRGEYEMARSRGGGARNLSWVREQHRDYVGASAPL